MPRVLIKQGSKPAKTVAADDASRQAHEYLLEHGLDKNLEYLRITPRGDGMTAEVKSAHGFKVHIAFDSDAHTITVTLC